MHPVSILSVCFLLPARCILLTAYCILHIASCILLGSGQELENALCRFRIFVILATPSPPSLHWQPWGHPHHLCHSFSLLPLVTLSTLVTLLLSAPLPTRLPWKTWPPHNPHHHVPLSSLPTHHPFYPLHPLYPCYPSHHCHPVHTCHLFHSGQPHLPGHLTALAASKTVCAKFQFYVLRQCYLVMTISATVFLYC